MAAEHKVDVFVSGAGPVGLLLTYQLARLGISTYIIDAADKASPHFPMYGRACTLYPRTLEMLDQLDLFDEMAQTGFIGKRNFTYKDGQRIQGRGWSGIEDISGSFFDFLLNIRLKYSEDVFRRRVAELGSKVQAPVKLVDLVLDDKAADEYKVTCTCANPHGKSFKVMAKYVVGCDGGSSMVRKLAHIPFTGEDKEDHWVRIDGVVKSNVPDSRLGFGAIESKTHGHVLWVALDHSATRIGYVLTPEMYAKYGKDMSKEDAVKEAKAAVAPFELEFEQVDWHTVYVVKQHVAERLQDRERILLAGDAAHTHSPGSAQGMNMGTHDVVSLGWRLAGVLNGWYKAEVLANYSEERRAIALQLIENDKVIAALISGHKPDRFKDRKESHNFLLDEFFHAIQPFAFGLGVEYPANLLNDVEGSYPPIGPIPGQRAPDARVHKAGFSTLPKRLHEVTKYNGKFHVVVFTGEPRDTRSSLHTLRNQVDTITRKFEHAISYRTIVVGNGPAFAEYLGLEQFGDAYWDLDSSAHIKYKISLDAGGIVVIRPDGILGFVAPLNGFDKVAEYLGRLIIPREQKEVVANWLNGDVGEMITQDENNLYYQQAREQGLPQSIEQGAV